MSNPTTADWRKFHYGEKKKVTNWKLIDHNGNTLRTGTYAFCAGIRKWMVEQNPSLKQNAYKLKIVPA